MRRLLALPILALATGVSLQAQAPSRSAQQTFMVSVEVVRPCSIDAHDGSANVTCSQQSASQPFADMGGAKPLVIPASNQTTDSTVTVEF
jgi:hypothetical protein